MKIEITRSLVRMVGLQKTKSFLKKLLREYVKAKYIRLPFKKVFRIFIEGLGIWKELLQVVSDFMTVLFTGVIFSSLLAIILIPIMDFMLSTDWILNNNAEWLLTLKGGLLASVVSAGIITIRIFIEWFHYLRR